MGWIGGIPDFIGPYTYFNNLALDIGTDIVAVAKRNLYAKVTAHRDKILQLLNQQVRIDAANSFLKKVAASERNKELAAVQSYCDELKLQFPQLSEFMKDPNYIIQNPEEFYLQLTNAINEIHLKKENYVRELKRIKHGIEVGRSFSQYHQDDYRFRLVDDLPVFMSHLTKKQLWNNRADTTFASKITEMTLEILNKLKLPEKITSGEDFMAIAAAVFSDLEQKIQYSLDKKNTYLPLDTITDGMLKKIQAKYLNDLNTTKSLLSPISRALNNIGGTDYQRIITNVKALLNIKTDSSEKGQDLATIQAQQYASYINNLPIRRRKTFKKLQKMISPLSEQCHPITFSISGTYTTKHGTINELILSAIGSNVKKNVGTDIITYTISWQSQLNTQFMDTLISNVENQFSSTIESGSLRNNHLRNITGIIQSANTEVDRLINTAEEQLQAEGKLTKKNDIFVFHETLKLYSSVETGRSQAHAGFGGRKLNILSFIDYLSSIANVGLDSSDIIPRGMLAFLSRNLIQGAIANQAIGPLERYFSIYAGMIMFDDVINMAKEAVNGVNNTSGGKIRQIHLYNLNGIYVPASMLLEQISNITIRDASSIFNELITAHITTGALTPEQEHDEVRYNTISNTNKPYLNNFIHNSINHPGTLSERDWANMTSTVVSSTKVQIIFLASFQAFINKLFDIQ